MKFLHLGKTLNDVSFLEDQVCALDLLTPRAQNHHLQNAYGLARRN